MASFDILDGFRVKAVADHHWLGHIYEDSEGQLYTFNEKGVATYNSGIWGVHPVPEINNTAALKKFAFRNWFQYPDRINLAALDVVAVVPLGARTAIVLAGGHLLEWNQSAGSTKVIRGTSQTGLGEFIGLEPAGPWSAWVMGNKGFARITLKDPTRSLYDWAEIHPAVSGLTSFAGAFDEGDGKIFVTADSSTGKRVAVLVKGGQSAVLASVAGERSLLWPGADGRVWQTDRRSIGYTDGKQTWNLPPSPELSGQILDVLPQPGGSFWIATSQQLAHYSPPLWREAPGAPPLTRLVSSIIEDAAGRIWFAADTTLIVDDHGLWQQYQLPRGEEYRAGITKGLCALKDGTILIDVGLEDHHLIFDPHTAHFKIFTRGGGQELGLILPRNSGGLWVESYVAGSRSFRFEILEDGVYRPVPGLGGPMTEVRDLLEARNGDIWVGTTSYLARFHEGQFHVLSAADGFMDTGAYSLGETPDGSVYIGGRKGVTVWDGRRFGPLETSVARGRSFAETGGTFWIASETGVDRYQNGEWIGNSSEEGLPGAGYKVFCDTTGRLWAGTTFGLRVYHPEADGEAPETRISEDRNLRRAPPGGDVRLNFQAADKWNLTQPERLLFSYSLDKGAWSHFEADNFASFKSLAAGRHTFHVRSMDRNGNIDHNPVAFDFSVLRPWYREPLFLLMLVVAVAAIAALVRAAAQRHMQLRFESRHDPLTRLFNRASFEAALDHAVESAARGGRFAVLFLDLDGFKRVNDTLGHRRGDVLLVAVSGRIDSSLRGDGSIGRAGPRSEVPTLARIGGDEFSIILPGADAAQAEAVAARILEAVRGCASIEGHAIRISCCIGISLFPDHGRDAATMLRLADVAMYEGKAGAKDCSRICDPAMNKIDFGRPGMAVLV